MPWIYEASAVQDEAAGVRTTATSRTYSVVMDQAAMHGGTGRGMCPIEMLLSAFGGCLVMTANYVAKKRGIAVRKIRVDLAGTMGEEPGYNGLNSVRVTFGFQGGDLTAEAARELAEATEAACPVSSSLKGSVRIELAAPVLS